ncbi:MAG: DUF1841 family protein [Sedimenticola sp.]
MFGNDRLQMRRMFTDSWQKSKQGAPLEPLEKMIVEIIQQHPEYHKMLEDPDGSLDRDFMPEEGQTNPFLHMGMHISIQEQISTDRPAGIRLAYQKLSLKTGDHHEAEHKMMECLGRMLWEAQRSGGMPDENLYLECVRQI